MKSVEQYGRIQLCAEEGMKCLHIATPSGAVETAPVFLTQDYDFSYDFHGYEEQTPKGKVYFCARFTPEQPGEYHVLNNDGTQRESFVCVASDNPGYVRVSRKDNRYFAFTDGESYVPLGINLCLCPYDRQPAGQAHFVASQATRTMGQRQWRRWFKKLRDNGGNYIRLWLSGGYTQARTEIMGVHDLSALARLDQVMELARESGIRVKMCFDHFRTFTDTSSFAYKRIVDPDTGRPLTDVNEWFSSEKWNARWLEDIMPYLARYQNDPVVFAWELWNEIEATEATFETVEGFTRRMLPRVRAISPKNMVVNSLGSYDEAWKQSIQDAFAAIPDMDFAQVHRYMDQGAPLALCHEDPVAFSVDAVQCCLGKQKPVLLAETGAVNDRHVGPFRFYNADHDGLIFDDVTYPPFFAGAAGCGHIWHWDNYVDAQNLWGHLKPLHDALNGIAVDAEEFLPFNMHNDKVWIFGLRGKTTTLVLVRSRMDRWDRVLRDDKPSPVLQNIKIAIPKDAAQVFWFVGEQKGTLRRVDGGWSLSGFTHGAILRLG